MSNAPPSYQNPGQAPAGAYQPQQGYGAAPQGGYAPPPAGAVPPPQYNVTVTQPAAPGVVVVGGCPTCKVGTLQDDFTCLGIVCAILFFPLGILCCLAMRQRRCTHCGTVFG